MLETRLAWEREAADSEAVFSFPIHRARSKIGIQGYFRMLAAYGQKPEGTLSPGLQRPLTPHRHRLPHLLPTCHRHSARLV